MTDRRFTVTPYRALVFFATVCALTSVLFLIDSNFSSQRDQFQESDYIMTFYVAGHLVAAGRAQELYPLPDAPSFVDSPFDKAVHALLPHVQKQSTGAYMYIPLIAGIFVPFSYVDPNWSLFFWQALSVFALGVSCYLLAQIARAKSQEVFFLSFLFAPVFLTLWTGQLGLGFGLLPLCIGLALVLNQRQFSAGICWSLLLLKPQFFLAAAFVAITLAIVRRFYVFLGMSVGVIALIAVTLLVFGIGPTNQWLLSHRVSDATYSSGLQIIPSHLITGLPANLLILFPTSLRESVKVPLYAISAAFWIFGLWYCVKFAKSQQNLPTTILITFIIGLLLSSLTLPHLLYYDLCLLLPAGVLLLSKNGPFAGSEPLRWIAKIGWIVVSGFFPLLLAFANYKILPLTLEIMLLILFTSLLWIVNKNVNSFMKR
jgi:hypothetical protein